MRDVHSSLCRALDRTPQISAADERTDLAAHALGDTAAGQRVVAGNVRFVLSIARRYGTPGSQRYNEIVSVGMLGLANALTSFDTAHGVRFVTHAGYHVRVAIQRYQARIRLVPLPYHGATRRAAAFLRRHGATSVEDLASKAEVSLESARVAWLASENETPLDDQAYTTEDPIEGIAFARASKAARLAVMKLSGFEQSIIRGRLMCDEPATYAELGKKLGRSANRIREAEKTILTKLRRQLWKYEEAA